MEEEEEAVGEEGEGEGGATGDAGAPRDVLEIDGPDGGAQPGQSVPASERVTTPCARRVASVGRLLRPPPCIVPLRPSPPPTLPERARRGAASLAGT